MFDAPPEGHGIADKPNSSLSSFDRLWIAITKIIDLHPDAEISVVLRKIPIKTWAAGGNQAMIWYMEDAHETTVMKFLPIRHGDAEDALGSK